MSLDPLLYILNCDDDACTMCVKRNTLSRYLIEISVPESDGTVMRGLEQLQTQQSQDQ